MCTVFPSKEDAIMYLEIEKGQADRVRRLDRGDVDGGAFLQN